MIGLPCRFTLNPHRNNLATISTNAHCVLAVWQILFLLYFFLCFFCHFHHLFRWFKPRHVIHFICWPVCFLYVFSCHVTISRCVYPPYAGYIKRFLLRDSLLPFHRSSHGGHFPIHDQLLRIDRKRGWLIDARMVCKDSPVQNERG